MIWSSRRYAVKVALSKTELSCSIRMERYNLCCSSSRLRTFSTAIKLDCSTNAPRENACICWWHLPLRQTQQWAADHSQWQWEALLVGLWEHVGQWEASDARHGEIKKFKVFWWFMNFIDPTCSVRGQQEGLDNIAVIRSVQSKCTFASWTEGSNSRIEKSCCLLTTVLHMATWKT